jgi:hypothetical protein
MGSDRVLKTLHVQFFKDKLIDEKLSYQAFGVKRVFLLSF